MENGRWRMEDGREWHEGMVAWMHACLPRFAGPRLRGTNNY